MRCVLNVKLLVILTEKQASYLLALKDNQPKLAQDVRWLFDDALARDFRDVPHDFFQTQEQGYGRFETRKCWVLCDLSYLEMRAWTGLTRVVMIQSERTIKSLTSTERRYYLSSLEASAEVTLASIRSHWSVENSFLDHKTHLLDSKTHLTGGIADGHGRCIGCWMWCSTRMLIVRGRIMWLRIWVC